MPIIGLSLITVYMEKSIPSSLQISKFFNTSIMPFLSSLSSRPNISYSTNSFLFTWLCSLSAPLSVFSLLLANSHSSINHQLLLEIVQSYSYLPLSSYSHIQRIFSMREKGYFPHLISKLLKILRNLNFFHPTPNSQKTILL